MKSIKKLPNSEDFKNNWNVFFNLIEVLKPTKIIFVGFNITDKLEISLKKSSYCKIEILWLKKIGNNFSKRAIIENQDLKKHKIIYCFHPCRIKGEDSFIQ
jgi:hypothetical protein